MIANGENQILRAQSEIVAVSGFHGGARLVGSWTLDGEPPVKRNVLELGAIDLAVHETLTLGWTLQQEFGGDICAHMRQKSANG